MTKGIGIQRTGGLKGFIALIIMVTLILGGCSNMKESEKQALYQEAESSVVQYFKQKYELDVVITSKELLPEMAVSQIGLKGHVKDHEDQSFGISYDYKRKQPRIWSLARRLRKPYKRKGTIRTPNKQEV